MAITAAFPRGTGNLRSRNRGSAPASEDTEPRATAQARCCSSPQGPERVFTRCRILLPGRAGLKRQIRPYLNRKISFSGILMGPGVARERQKKKKCWASRA